jgi:hypothetical protein
MQHLLRQRPIGKYRNHVQQTQKNQPLDVTSVSDVKAVKEPRRQSNAARNVDAFQSIVIDAPDA